MRILVLCDDYWHPARTPRAGLAPLTAQGFAFDWIEQAQDWSAATMASYPCVLLTKANNLSAADQTPWASPQVATAFVAYVEHGGGLLVVHSGAAGYAELPTLRAPSQVAGRARSARGGSACSAPATTWRSGYTRLTRR